MKDYLIHALAVAIVKKQRQIKKALKENPYLGVNIRVSLVSLGFITLLMAVSSGFTSITKTSLENDTNFDIINQEISETIETITVIELPLKEEELEEVKEVIPTREGYLDEEISAFPRYATREIKELDNETIIENILREYDLTRYQFDVIVGIVLAEAKACSYDDAYGVINTIGNRTNSITWSTYFTNGENLYIQAVAPGQFAVYEEGKYLNYLGCYDEAGYQAIIDYLTSGITIHDYLSFKSADSYVANSIQLVAGGNRYHGLMTEDDRLIRETQVEEHFFPKLHLRIK